MAGSTRGVTLVAKALGGKKVQEEFDKIGESVKKTGTDAETADRDAERSGHGWEIFRKRVKGVGDTAKHSHTMIKSLIGGVIGLASGYVGFAGIKNIATSAALAADEAEKLHITTGANVQSSLDWITVAKSRGVGEKLLSQGMVLLAKNIYAAERQEITHQHSMETAAKAGHLYNGLLGSQAASLRQLGLSYLELKKLSPEEQFLLVSKKLSMMTNSSEKARIAALLFGRGVKELMPLMTSDALGMEAQLKIAKEYLPELGLKGPKAFENFRLAQAKTNMAMEGLKLTIGLKVLPAVLKLFNAFDKLVLNIERGHGVWGTVGKVVGGVAHIFETLWHWVTQNRVGLAILMTVLGFLGSAFAIEKILEFIGAVQKLTIVEMLWTGVQTIVNAVGFSTMMLFGTMILGIGLLILAVYLIITHWKMFEGVLKDVWAWIKSVWAQMERTLVEPFVNAWHYIENGFNGLVKFFESLPERIGRAASGMFNGIWNAFKASINWIIGGWDKLHFTIGGGSFLGVHWPEFTLGVPRIPMLASGGNLQTAGSVIVGERGPEMLSLPTGARVTPLDSSRLNSVLTSAMYEAGQGEGDLHVHVEIEGKEVANTVIRNFKKREGRS